MGTSFYPTTLTATPKVMVERYGFEPVMLGPVEGHTYEDAVAIGRDHVELIIDALGLPKGRCGDHSGDITPTDLLGRITMAEALAPQDEGMPMHRLQRGEMSSVMSALVGDGDAAVYSCGRPEGYLQMRLAELRELTERCAREGWTISWA